MTLQPEQATGIALTAAAAIIAKRYRALDDLGIAVALAIALTLLLVEARLLLLMMLFFFTSSAFTLLGYEEKERKGVAERKCGRSMSQVLCSGIVPAFLALLASIASPEEKRALTLAAAASIAYANADTWAAEIGSLSRGDPVLITKPRTRVPPGVSGGVTMLGELGAAGGSAAIATTAGLLALSTPIGALLIFMLGWVGELLDAVIGALLQVKYRCPRCDTLTDREIHVCGTPAIRVGGVKFVKNEIVNLLTELVVSLLAFSLTLRYP